MKQQIVKKATFNSGFLNVYLAHEILLNNVPFGDQTITENRFNAAVLGTGDRIDRVIRIPLNIDDPEPTLPQHSTIQINDHRYTIYKQQPIHKSNPPINVITLKEFE